MFVVRNGEYLSTNLNFSREKRDAAWFIEERVSKVLTRFRFAQMEKYLCSLEGKTFGYSERSNDSTLFLFLNNNTCETIHGQTFQIENFAHNHFYEHGFLVLPNVLPSLLIESAAKKILFECGGEKQQSRISNLFALDGETFCSILKLPILKCMLELLFKVEFHLTTYSSNTLFAKEEESKPCFHVDYPYHTDLFRDQIEAKNKLLGIQVIIPLTNFNFENGATLFIPKSFGDGWSEKNECCFFLAPKGSLIFYRADLVHSQGCNKTDSPRIALLANFAPLCVPAKDNILDQAKHTPLMIRDGKVFL